VPVAGGGIALGVAPGETIYERRTANCRPLFLRRELLTRPSAQQVWEKTPGTYLMPRLAKPRRIVEWVLRTCGTVRSQLGAIVRNYTVGSQASGHGTRV